MSFGPSYPHVPIAPHGPSASAGRAGRPDSDPHERVRGPFRRARLARTLRRVAALALALAACGLVARPALGAEAPAPAGVAPHSLSVSRSVTMPPVVAQDEPREREDAFDGGFVPPSRQIVIPTFEVGLSRQRPIPVGVTCSCTIDRVGQISQFDITVIEVVQDASAMVQQLNRFNRPPRPGARYVAAYVGQQYIAGPQDQAYFATEADWHSTATDGRLSDVAQLLRTEIEYRPRAEVYPQNYVNGWLIFELPINRPAFMVWKYNFVGERGIWFALQ